MGRKKYIVLIVILVVFFLIMILLFGVDSLKKSSQSLTIIVGDNTVWSYHDKKWSNKGSYYNELNWKKYHVYFDNEEKGEYYLWHDDKWYVFDKNKNAVPFNGELLAYESNRDISIASFSEEDVVDDFTIPQVLEDNNISVTDQFTSKYQVSFDIDSDGEDEVFYVLSNAFATEFYPDTVFSIVYMVKDDKIYSIYEDVTANSVFNGCKPYFQSFLDIDQDNTYEFILSCGYYSNARRSDMLYRLTDEGFKIVISN